MKEIQFIWRRLSAALFNPYETALQLRLPPSEKNNIFAHKPLTFLELAVFLWPFAILSVIFSMTYLFFTDSDSLSSIDSSAPFFLSNTLEFILYSYLILFPLFFLLKTHFYRLYIFFLMKFYNQLWTEEERRTFSYHATSFIQTSDILFFIPIVGALLSWSVGIFFAFTVLRYGAKWRIRHLLFAFLLPILLGFLLFLFCVAIIFIFFRSLLGI